MSRTNNPNGPLTLDTQIDEDRVRRALGLKSGGAPHQQRPEQARQRHRFVTDGAVPVVMVNRADSETVSLREKLSAAESALEAERAAHAGTRRILAEAQAAVQQMQTRIGHIELSHSEALKSERDARRIAEESLASLQADRAITPKRTIKVRAAAPANTDPLAVVEPVKPARAKREPAVKEPKPVRWWTPSYRAKQSQRA